MMLQPAGLAATASRMLSIPDSFTETALAFPDKCIKALALLDDPLAVKELLDKAEAMAVYARRIESSTLEANAIQEGKLLIIARLGELSPATNKGGRGKKNLSTPVDGFSHQTIATYRKVAKHKDKISEFRKQRDEAKDDMSLKGFVNWVGAGGILASKMSGEQEWYTPIEYVELARKTMGSIDLDPASCETAQKTIKATTYYTAHDDGLAKEWCGNVWLNPPHKMPLVDRFTSKLRESFQAGSVKQAILLTNNTVDTRWWHRIAEISTAICLTRGRIKFYNDAGESTSPTNGQAFCYLGYVARANRHSFAPLTSTHYLERRNGPSVEAAVSRLVFLSK